MNARTSVVRLLQGAGQVGDAEAAAVVANILEQQLRVRRHAVARVVAGTRRRGGCVRNRGERARRIAGNGARRVRAVEMRAGAGRRASAVVVVGGGARLHPVGVHLVAGMHCADAGQGGRIGEGDFGVRPAALVEGGEPGFVRVQARIGNAHDLAAAVEIVIPQRRRSAQRGVDATARARDHIALDRRRPAAIAERFGGVRQHPGHPFLGTRIVRQRIQVPRFHVHA